MVMATGRLRLAMRPSLPARWAVIGRVEERQLERVGVREALPDVVGVVVAGGGAVELYAQEGHPFLETGPPSRATNASKNWWSWTR